MPEWKRWERGPAPSVRQDCWGCGKLIDSGWRLVGVFLVHQCDECHQAFIERQAAKEAGKDQSNG